jgi:hypothetical protein
VTRAKEESRMDSGNARRSTMYHVVIKDWDGDDLLSLYQQIGDAAYEEYAEKWPEAGELGQYHVHYVHLHATLDQAREFVEEFGGEILEVNTEDLDIVIDNLEYPHSMVRDRIPAEYVKRI